MHHLFRVALLTGFIVLLRFITIAPLSTKDPIFVNPNYDHFYYLAMATDGPGNAVAPFAYRRLTPTLARLFPDVGTGFRLITVLAEWATAMALYIMLRGFGFSYGISTLSACLYVMLYWTVGFAFYDFWLPDALLQLLIVLSLIAIQRGQWHWLTLILVLGVLDKETIIAVMPLWFTLRPRREWKQGLLAIFPALFVLGLLRLIIPVTNAYNLLALPGQIWQYRIEHSGISLNLLWQISAGTFSVALFLVTLAPQANRRWLSCFWPFLLLCYVQLLVASDVERLLILAFPAVFVMMAEGAKVALKQIVKALFMLQREVERKG